MPLNEQEQRPPFSNYLHAVLVDGVKPFRYRGRVCSLLGVPDQVTEGVSFPSPLPPVGFKYTRDAATAVPDLTPLYQTQTMTHSRLGEAWREPDHAANPEWEQSDDPSNHSANAPRPLERRLAPTQKDVVERSALPEVRQRIVDVQATTISALPQTAAPGKVESLNERLPIALQPLPATADRPPQPAHAPSGGWPLPNKEKGILPNQVAADEPGEPDADSISVSLTIPGISTRKITFPTLMTSPPDATPLAESETDAPPGKSISAISEPLLTMASLPVAPSQIQPGERSEQLPLPHKRGTTSAPNPLMTVNPQVGRTEPVVPGPSTVQAAPTIPGISAWDAVGGAVSGSDERPLTRPEEDRPRMSLPVSPISRPNPILAAPSDLPPTTTATRLLAYAPRPKLWEDGTILEKEDKTQRAPLRYPAGYGVNGNAGELWSQNKVTPFNRSQRETAELIEQLRQTVHQLTAKMAAQAVRPPLDTVAPQPARPTVQPSPVVRPAKVVNQPARQTRTSPAFWERRHLGRFRFALLR